MKTLLLFSIIWISFNAINQVPVTVPENGCNPIGISTNPDDYQNPLDPMAESQWDWREQYYTMFISGTNGTTGTQFTIVNPFYDQSNQPTTSYLADAQVKDFAPEDGWELLYKHFGTATDGVNTPYFILYNRFSGTTRAFVNIINSGSFAYTAAGLKLSFKENPNEDPTEGESKIQTAVLNLLGEYTFANDQIQRNAEHFTPNEYLNAGINNNYYWLYADFNTLYDPCTCGAVSDWKFEAGLIANIEINLALNGTLTTVVDANPNGNNPNQTDVGFFGTIQKYISFGSGIISGVQGVVKSGNKGFADGQALITESQTFATNTAKVIGREKAQNLANILGNVFSFAPQVNMFLNTANSLITFVKKVGQDYDALTNNDPKGIEAISKPKVTQSDLKVTGTGDLIVSAPYVNSTLRVPGSKPAPGQGSIDSRNPIYDEVLGVWNLFQQPQFQLTAYKSGKTLLDIIDVGTPDPSNPYAPGIEYVYDEDARYFPYIYQLELAKVPKILLNPASGLKVVDIDYQVVFDSYDSPLGDTTFRGVMRPGNFEYFTDTEFDFGPLFGNVRRHAFYSTTYADREAYTAAMGYELSTRNNDWDTSVITTPYLSQSCVMSYPIFSYSEIVNPKLRVKVILEPEINDPNSEVDQMIFIHTFPGITRTEVSKTPYTVGGTVHLDQDEIGFEPVTVNLPIDMSNYLSGYSVNSVLSNEQITQDITVMGDLTILNGVTFGPGNHVIRATKDIHIHSSMTNLPPNTSVLIQAAENIYVYPEVEVEPEVVLEIQPSVKPSCDNVKEWYPSTYEIVTFCNSDAYGKSLDVDTVEQIIEEFDFVIFPNPTEGRATLRYNATHGDEKVEIYDMSGKQILFSSAMLSNGMELDVSHVDAGSYLVRVQSNLGSVTKQLIIVK